MRILLVKPSPSLDVVRRVHGFVLLEPLELGYLAAAVPQGHDVRVLDLRLAKRPGRAFEREIDSFRPDVLGISGYTHEAARVKSLAHAVREKLPDTTIVVGGHHATVLPDDYNMDCFDAIVRGEGCAPFCAIIEALSSGRPMHEIANVLVPGERFDRVAAAEMPRYPDLGTVPTPRHDLWDPRGYRCVWPSEKRRNWQTLFPPTALVRSSFGCLMDCSFCAVPRLCGGRHMRRPPDMVASEIERLEVDHVYFCDDETFLDAGHAMRLAEAIEGRGIRKRYFAWARSTTVIKSPELFRYWRGIGLDAVFLGFEATSDEELREVSKHTRVSDNQKAHATLREMGIAVQAGFMVSPRFTAPDFERLRGYLEDMPPAQVTFTVFTPSPRSPAWNEQMKEFVADPIALHDCMHPLTPTAMPLREFYREFADLVLSGAKKNPLRNSSVPVRPWDVLRIWWIAYSYVYTLRRAYRDFPRHLW